MGKEDIVISTRIPRQTLIQIKKTVGKEYVNEADFVRSAIRSELFKNKIRVIKDELWKTQNSTKAIHKLRNLFTTFPDSEYESWVQNEVK